MAEKQEFNPEKLYQHVEKNQDTRYCSKNNLVTPYSHLRLNHLNNSPRRRPPFPLSVGTGLAKITIGTGALTLAALSHESARYASHRLGHVGMHSVGEGLKDIFYINK